jgi:hypothetical protein
MNADPLCCRHCGDPPVGFEDEIVRGSIEVMIESTACCLCFCFSLKQPYKLHARMGGTGVGWGSGVPLGCACNDPKWLSPPHGTEWLGAFSCSVWNHIELDSTPTCLFLFHTQFRLVNFRQFSLVYASLTVTRFFRGQSNVSAPAG